MMQDTRCPGCRAEWHDNNPSDNDVITCVMCGYIGVWDTDSWRLLNSEEHSKLMMNQSFLEVLEYGLAFRSWRDRDTAQLCTVIHSQLDRFPINQDIITGLTREIMAAGYHTHPSASDIKALGLDKHEDEL
jgi:hypothetical protein